MTKLLFLVAAFSGLAIFQCGRTPVEVSNRGSSTEVVGKLVSENGGPAIGTAVYLRPADFLPNVSAKIAAKSAYKTLDTTVTDSRGNFQFDSIAPGTYMLECLDGEPGNGALIDSVTITNSDSVELPTDTLKPLGRIAGQIQIPDSAEMAQVRIMIYGLDRITVPDSTGGFSIPGLPEGGYNLHIVGPNISIDMKGDRGAEVIAGQTTNLPVSLLTLMDTSLVGYWPFDESSGQMAYDASGNGNTGILGGSASADSMDPIWAAGKFGSCLQFDSINDSRAVVDIAGTSLDSLTTFTYEAWINPTDWGRYARILSQETAAKDGFYICLYGYSWLNFGASIADTDTNYAVNSDSNSIALNTWQHIAVTFDDAGDRTLHLFINGQDAGYIRPPRAMSGALRFNSSPMVIGNSTVGNQSFMGKIDEIKIYNRVLSQSEILAEASR